MKITKVTLIVIGIILIIFIGIYSSIPIIIKLYLPTYIHSHIPISKINFEKVHYPAFNKLNLDNVEFTINRKGINLTIIIPKVVIHLGIQNFIDKNPHVQIIHPVILGKLNFGKLAFKDSLSKRPSSTKSRDLISKKNFSKSFPLKLFDNLYVKKGDMLFNSIKLKKIKIKGLKAEFNYGERKIFIDNIDGDVFEGKIKGKVDIEVGVKMEDIVYNARFDFLNINSSNITNLINSGKCELSGKYTGQILVKGGGYDIRELSGNLSSDNKGGRININEDRMKNILKNKSNQFKLAIEQLKDFEYNKGEIKIETLDNNLLIKVIFKGKQGKKDIEFVFHNLLGGGKWFIK